MGVGDFFDALVESNPLTSAAKAGVMWGAEKFSEKSQASMDQSRRDSRVGNVGVAANPIVQQATNIANNPAGAPYRAVGEYVETQGQNKIEAAQFYGKLGKTLVTDPGKVWEGGKQFAGAVKENPSILGHIAVEAGISTALDPTTYLGGGAAVGAGVMERFAARGGRRAVAEVAEEAPSIVAHTADELAEAGVKRGAKETAEAAAREAAPSTAEAARAVGRQTTRSGRMLNRVDQLPANLREAMDLPAMGRIAQKRFDIGERLMPGAQSSPAGALVKDALQKSPTMPTEGALLGVRQAKWRTQQVGRRAMLPAKLNRARQIEKVGVWGNRFLNDPQAALASPEVHGLIDKGINWAVTEHPEAVAAVGGAAAGIQAYGAYKGLKSLLGGGGEEGAAEEARPATGPPLPEATAQVGLMQFRADQTHATRTSRRRAGAPTQLGTVTRDSTMPSAIGPSNWYGPQGGYDAGRGFQQRPTTPSGALPPLEQPTTRPRETAGI
jgi:hypothetical protein